MQIKVENTAISNGVATSVKKFLDTLNSPVLDYGAGKLRNAKYLAKMGFEVSVLDTTLQVNKWSNEDKSLFKEVFTDKLPETNTYNTIFVTFVLNVVPDIEVRKSILHTVHNALTEEGTVIVEVRRNRGIMQSKTLTPYNDGFLLGGSKVKTFQKPFTEEEARNLVEEFFEVVELWKTGDSIIVRGVKRCT